MSKAGPKKIEKVEDLDGVQRCAVLMLSLGRESAGVLLKRLSPEEIEEVTRELASLGEVSKEVSYAIVEEYYHTLMAQNWALQGGLEYASDLLRDSVDPDVAKKIITQISQQVQKTPFAFLQKAESANLLTFIQDEHPQTIALILSHLPYHKSAEVLGGLPTQKQVEVIKRVANMEQTNPEVITEVERGLESRLASMLTQRFDKTGGVESVAEMLNIVDRTTEKGILEGIEAEDPDLVEQIRRLMFVFEDVNLLDDKSIQMVLKEVDNDELALGLKTASEELSDKIFKNMSDRAAQLVKEDMEFMGPVRVSDVEAAQQRIVDIVRRLEDSGEIIVAGRGGQEQLIV